MENSKWRIVLHRTSKLLTHFSTIGFFILIIFSPVSNASKTKADGSKDYSCTCSTQANTNCNNYCISNGSSGMASQTCTLTGGPEGYCYCVGGVAHGVQPGSMCDSKNR